MRTWITKEGKVLNIKEMEKNHIINCIKMLERKIENDEVYEITGGGLDRDDIWFDQEDMTLEIEYQIFLFKKELERRKKLYNQNKEISNG